jgi:hypothetical protein
MGPKTGRQYPDEQRAEEKSNGMRAHFATVIRCDKEVPYRPPVQRACLRPNAQALSMGRRGLHAARR